VRKPVRCRFLNTLVFIVGDSIMKAIWISVLSVLCFSSTIFANTAPTVTNITASQRTDGSHIVDIYYTLTDADDDDCTISIEVSNDGGLTWDVIATAFSGDIGVNIISGTKHISWDCQTDLPEEYGTNYRIKIIADDNYSPPEPDITWVYINDPGVSGHEPFNGYMSKYETTNAQYAQYLNAAKASGDVTVSGNYVVGTSGPYSGQNYYNLTGSGSTFNGATNGGAARIDYSGDQFTVDSGFENHPVTYVSWYGATAFAGYYGWRLPTEWEWNAIADYNGSYTFGCGTTLSNSKANYYDSTHPYGTTAVGAFGTYGYGMCNMAGNVWEKTSSIIYGSSNRVSRGGGWSSGGIACAISSPGSSSPTSMGSKSGFRVCR